MQRAEFSFSRDAGRISRVHFLSDVDALVTAAVCSSHKANPAGLRLRQLVNVAVAARRPGAAAAEAVVTRAVSRPTMGGAVTRRPAARRIVRPAWSDANLR